MPANDKMKNALLSGCDPNAEHALKVLKSDECRLLGDYFDFDRSDLTIDAELHPNGRVEVTIKVSARGFRPFGKTL